MHDTKIISLVKEIVGDGSTKDFALLSALQFNEPYQVVVKSIDLSHVQKGFNIGGTVSLYIERHEISGSQLRFSEDRRFLTVGPGVWASPQNWYPNDSISLGCNLYTPYAHLDVNLSFQSNDVLVLVGSANLVSAVPSSTILVVSCLIQYEILNPFQRK